MNLREITDAINAGRKATVEQAFCKLVTYPDEGRIEASSPGLIVVALNRVLADLAYDENPMTAAACKALILPEGSSFIVGVVMAKHMRTDICRRIVDRFDR
jgi:hypothetical protein